MKRKMLFRIVGSLIAATLLVSLSVGLVSCSRREKFDRLALGMSENEVKSIFGDFDKLDETYADGYSSMSDWEKLGFQLKVGKLGFQDCSFAYVYGDAYNEIEKLNNIVSAALELNNADLINEYYEKLEQAKEKPYTKTRFVFDRDGKLIEAFIDSECLYKDVSVDDYGERERVCTRIFWLDGEPAQGDVTVAVKLNFEDGSRYMGYANVEKIENGTAYLECPWGKTTCLLDNAE